jgi:glyoxylase-like metal-dependent hydrolase (beta-lactamase superfamily II)
LAQSIRIMPADPAIASLLQGISVFERGWLSSNNILLHGDGAGAVLVDSGHALHAEQTVALVRHGLRDEPLARIVNTHLHSDHCGGNAVLQRAFDVPITIPPGHWHAVQSWDDAVLSYQASGQWCERFSADARLEPGDTLAVGTRGWRAIGSPGHDPHSVMLHDAEGGVLISADALWENGFGIVFPELDGEPGFDDVAAVLDAIEALGVRCVIPGHGAPFTDVAGALARARSRLGSFRADPARHLRHGIKVLIKYHLLEVQEQPLAEFGRWFASMPLAAAAWDTLGRPQGSIEAWGRALVAELCAGGALAVIERNVCNAEAARP